MFRRERPQRGRYRQFHQIGAEALGFGGPEVDAELILLAVALWRELGITRWRLELNSLGQPDERREHRAALVAYFEAHHEQLDEDARRRLHSNPLRILDTKNPAMRELVEGAPTLMAYLGEASLKHFEGVQTLLKDAGLPYRINPRLVRGLDYYNLTVFEWVTDQLGAQGTVCAGGRYDGLIGMFGKEQIPACGFSLGLERILVVMDERGMFPPEIAESTPADVMVTLWNEETISESIKLASELRSAGIRVTVYPEADKLGKQIKYADSIKVPFVCVLGENELAENKVTIKNMGSGEQNTVERDETGKMIAEYTA
jgi:histidyl-tRNA synthetase